MFNFLSRTKSTYKSKKKVNLKNEKVIQIESFSERIGEFGITFQSLASIKREEETKRLVMEIVLGIMDEPELVEYIFETKTLPLDVLSKKYNVSKKYLSAHEEYILALCVLRLEYPLILEFLNF